LNGPQAYTDHSHTIQLSTIFQQWRTNKAKKLESDIQVTVGMTWHVCKICGN